MANKAGIDPSYVFEPHLAKDSSISMKILYGYYVPCAVSTISWSTTSSRLSRRA